MDKVTYRAIQKAWQRFDATTAYGCANKGLAYNSEACQRAWKGYNDVLLNLGISIVTNPPIGLLIFDAR